MPGIVEQIKKRQKLSAFVFFLTFFALLFLQFPLKKAVSGNCDTWLALTYPGYTLEMIKSFFTGEKFGIPMYPAANPLSYGESAPGIQIIIMIIRGLGLADHWTNYIYITLIFSLTGLAVFIFAGNFTRTFSGSLLAGFIFTCSNMAFAHIDDSIIIFFFLPALSLHFLTRWFKERKNPLLYLSAILGGLQVYFSFYIFFYLVALSAFFIIFYYFQKKVIFKAFIVPFLIYSAIFLAISLPQAGFHYYTLKKLDFITPFEQMYTIKMASLNFTDMILVLPDNLIYPDLGKFLGIPMNWGFVRHYNFTGLTAFILLLYSFCKWNKYRLFIGGIALTGIILAIGPVFMFNMKEVFPTPLYILYDQIPILNFLRVGARAHFIFLFALAVGAALAAEKFSGKFRFPAIIITGMFILHFFENTPFPMKSFDASYTEKVPEVYSFIGSKDPNALIVELPSSMKIEYLNWDDKIFENPENYVMKNKNSLKIDNLGMFVNSWDDLFEYNREIIYMNWQLRHKLNSVNGVNGYFPTPRIMWQYQISRLPEPEALNTMRKWGADYLIWNTSMKIGSDKLSLETLGNSPCLEKVYSNKGSSAFKIKECEDEGSAE